MNDIECSISIVSKFKMEERARRAAKMFGLNEEQLQQAIDEARVEYTTGVAPSSDDGDLAALTGTLINYGLVLGLGAAIAYQVNVEYSGAFTKFFIQHFPREAVALGIVWPTEIDPETGSPVSYTV